MTFAFVFVNCVDDAQAISAKKVVKEVEGVLECYITSGIYDLVLKVHANDEFKLEEVIKRIKATAGIISTVTSIVYKRDIFAPHPPK